jgi:hypothetical protein
VPNLYPHNTAGERLYSRVESKTKPKPFVMLIDSEQVVHTSSPESPALKPTGFPLTH